MLLIASAGTLGFPLQHESEDHHRSVLRFAGKTTLCWYKLTNQHCSAAKANKLRSKALNLFPHSISAAYNLGVQNYGLLLYTSENLCRYNVLLPSRTRYIKEAAAFFPKCWYPCTQCVGRARRPRDRLPAGARYSATGQTGSEANPTSYPIAIVPVSRG